jgi:ligand-binding sensor domain-containing protein
MTVPDPLRRQLLAVGAAYGAGLGAALPWPAAHAATPTAPAGAASSPAAPRKFTHFRVGSKNVKRIYVDGDIVWVGTSGGAVRYDLKADNYKLYDNRSGGLLSNGVFWVGRIGSRIALGTYGGGLALLDEDTQRWKTYNIPDGLGDAFVYDVLAARNGDLWIATWSGVNRVRAGKLDDKRAWELHTVANTKGGLPNDWVYGLAEGLNGDIWLATEGGLCLFRDAAPGAPTTTGNWQNWNHAAGLGADYALVKDNIQFTSDPGQASEHHARQKAEMGLSDITVAYNPNYVVALAVDAAGVAWAGTWGGGLSRYDGKAWRHYTVTDGLPGNHVFMLQNDAAGELWIGTNQGLARKTASGFEIMTSRDGLFGDAVFAMASAPDGSLWVGSYGGVARLAPLAASGAAAAATAKSKAALPGGAALR